MRIVLHDYGAYGFPLQLSRTLAERGHQVLHLYAGFREPRTEGFDVSMNRPSTLAVESIDIGEIRESRASRRRLAQERRYGQLLASRVLSFDPDVVIVSTTPIDPMAAALEAAHQSGATFVFWLQDFYSVAIRRLLGRRVPIVGRAVSARFERLERRILCDSDAIVAITEDFVPTLTAWGIPPERVTIIENWAPLDLVQPGPKRNAWSIERGLAESPVFLYAGTLGRKHNPRMLVSLAKAVPGASIVVVAEGSGADWLRAHATELPNLSLLPLQPPDRLGEVLATADILVVLLEADAAEFSVPSKILTYLAAGRPILGAMPRSNLATRVIERSGAGKIVNPDDTDGFIAAARVLIENPAELAAAGRAGRRYAESAFDIDAIADRWEAIMAAGPRSTGASLTE
jgi:glycosyltransferase involved in cell wall biosynthesis